MSSPRFDRQGWEDELRELRAALTHFRHGLSAAPEEDRDLREMLAVKIKLVERRAASLRVRLAPPPDGA